MTFKYFVSYVLIQEGKIIIRNATLERDQLIETREDIDVMEAELQERAGAEPENATSAIAKIAFFIFLLSIICRLSEPATVLHVIIIQLLNHVSSVLVSFLYHFVIKVVFVLSPQHQTRACVVP